MTCNMRATTCLELAVSSVAIALVTWMGVNTSVAQAPAYQPKTYVAMHGNYACATGEAIGQRLDTTIGDHGCGMLYGLELGRTGVTIAPGLDSWAIRVRYGQTIEKQLTQVPLQTIADRFFDKRFVADIEAGGPTSFNLLGGETRMTFGVRFAQWRGAHKTEVAAGVNLGATTESRHDVLMGGARIGWQWTRSLGANWAIESNSGIALLYGRDQARSFRNDLTRTVLSPREGAVANFESEILLTYRFSGTAIGPALSLGLTSEAWLNQNANPSLARADHFDRFSWGPVARMRIPFGQ